MKPHLLWSLFVCMFDLLSRYLVFWARSSLQLYVCSSFYVFCVNFSQFSCEPTVVKTAIISVFSCWKFFRSFFPVGIMFTFMSNRCNTGNMDRSEAAHCRVVGCCCCSFRQIPCSCHRKKNPFISLLTFFFLILWSILAIGSNRNPNWKREVLSL